MTTQNSRKMTGYDPCIPAEKLNEALAAVDSEDHKVSVVVDGFQIDDLARPGHRFWFEYHCWESPESSDAEVWYHSHQQCTVIGVHEEMPCAFSTHIDRAEAGHSLTYRVRFDDGLEWTVFEDELLESRDDFFRPDPPPKPEEVRYDAAG